MSEPIYIKSEQFAGVHLETLDPPRTYPQEQLEFACGVAAFMLHSYPKRGKFVLTEPKRKA